MDKNTKKIIQERFDSLPDSIQELILSAQYVKTLARVGEENKLSVEQAGTLEMETTLVLMGLADPKHFESDLIQKLDLDKITCIQISKEITESIFSSVKELLELMNTPTREKPKLLDTEEAESRLPDTIRAILKSQKTQKTNNGDLTIKTDFLKSIGDIISKSLNK